ncbi:MAG: nitroreductase family protein [Bacteroidota bacterium]|nr:nitroreductase family protein [Bacteroidota bacterium]
MLSLIHNRKSVRHFQSGEVNKEKLEELVRAGMAAPSARDLRPWQFLIITHDSTLKNMAEQLPYAKMLHDVPAAIVVMGDSTVKSPSGQSYWLQDTCAATENILLAAEALGLGAVWTALYPYEERMQPVVKACNIPKNLIPLNIIPVGIPEGTDKPKDKWNPAKLHWNKWGKK